MDWFATLLAGSSMYIEEFFRIRGTRERMSSLRPLGYTIMGYAAAGPGSVKPEVAALNTAAIAGILMFGYSLNDMCDATADGEDNAAGRLLLTGGAGARLTALLCAMPLVLSLLLFWTPWQAAAAAGGLALACFLYSVPGVQLKRRRWGALVPPACAGLLLLQAVLTGRGLNLSLWCLGGLVVLNHGVPEALHCMHDGLIEQGAGRRAATAAAVLPLLPWLSAAACAVLGFVNPVFWVGVFSGAARGLLLARGLNTEVEVGGMRRIFNPALPTYEYIFYSAAGLMGAFS